MADITVPPASRPRTHFLDTAEAVRLAECQPEPYRTLSALLAGTGIEVSVALNLRRRDVDSTNREVRAAVTKNHNRDRVVRVAEWAWSYLEPHLTGLLPDARIFAAIPNRWSPGAVHRAAVDVLGNEFPNYRGYTMRDARHMYAVRAIRAGTPAEIVGRQLGHVNAVLVMTVYGRFVPLQRERDYWERIAAAQDSELDMPAMYELRP